MVDSLRKARREKEGRKQDRTDEQSSKAMEEGLASLFVELWGINHIPDLFCCLRGLALHTPYHTSPGWSRGPLSKGRSQVWSQLL